MRRIATMIASATEIVCSLGLGHELVARSHECDFPEDVTRLPVCTGPRFDVHGNSREIDERVKSLLSQDASIYQVDAGMLEELAPNVIITQGQCEVCAVSEKDVARALGTQPRWQIKVVSLSPNNLAEVWESIRNVADALEVSAAGNEVVTKLQSRVDAIAAQAKELPHPSVACLEWLDPLMAAGNWLPEMVSLAGGKNLFGVAGQHSPWMSWGSLYDADPDVILALPCGFDLSKTRAEMDRLTSMRSWDRLRAYRNRRLYLADGNQFFNRPGPRLVESLEILAEIMHPSVFRFGHEHRAWERYSLDPVE